VVEQTARRPFKAEPVPAVEKLVSIFEPHTTIIWQGQPNQATEFGHKVWLKAASLVLTER
jgi:IS5 family transposase